MKESRSLFLDIRGLRYHVRSWGDPAAPKLFLLHGWMDVSAAFQFTVDALEHEWHVLAPDWRGFGLSAWAEGAYWFPDYIADLDALLQKLQPDAPVYLVGHSMGGNAAGLYAGVRPDRVAKLVLAEGFGLPRVAPEKAPSRYARWLDELNDPPGFKTYASFAEVEARLKQNNPRLSDERARFLASHWAEEKASGDVRLRSDPKHKRVNPVIYRPEEAIACWKNISARVLWLQSDGPWLRNFMRGNESDLEAYRAAYRNLTEATIAESGHMMHLDQPERFARAIESFLLDQPAG